MFDQFLVTGATGNLGQALIAKLLERGAAVRALVLKGDDAAKNFPPEVSVFYGNVADKRSLDGFFQGDLSRACLVHCAGLITIASRPPEKLWQVNVEGTKNIMERCREHGVKRVIYVSSVHAVPEAEKGKVMTEPIRFSPEKVKGHYAKSKAAATLTALAAHRSGLNVSIVHPSGILCPAEGGKGNIAFVISRYCKGRLPLAVKGGYDFVDVRDVVEGIIACAQRGRSGECYLLSGHYATLEEILGYIRQKTGGKRVRYLPLGVVRLIAPMCELISVMKKEPLFLTPYSVYTLGSNALFSNEKAASELGFCPRPLSETLDDIVEGTKGTP